MYVRKHFVWQKSCLITFPVHIDKYTFTWLLVNETQCVHRTACMCVFILSLTVQTNSINTHTPHTHTPHTHTHPHRSVIYFLSITTCFIFIPLCCLACISPFFLAHLLFLMHLCCHSPPSISLSVSYSSLSIKPSSCISLWEKLLILMFLHSLSPSSPSLSISVPYCLSLVHISLGSLFLSQYSSISVDDSLLSLQLYSHLSV